MTDIPKKKKILHLIEGLGSGGAERLLHTNLKYLDKTEFDHEVASFFSGRDFWKGPIEKLGVPVLSLECKRLRSIFTGIRRLRKHIRLSRPDLIHTHLWAANVIGRIAGGLEGVPVVSSIHSPEYETESIRDAEKKARIWVLFARVIDRLTARKWCTRMIAVSEFVKRSTIDRLGFAGEKIDVLYNPVEDITIGYTDTDAAVFTTEGIPKNGKVLLIVGRMAPQKGMLYAVRSMPEILSLEPNAHLVLMGSSDDKNYHRALISEIERLELDANVHPIGERRLVASYLRACDVFLFPSVFEGMGIALAEAMACRCACAVSRIEPFDEFIEENVSGVYFNSRDPSDLAKKVVMLLSDPKLCERLGKTASVIAKEKFDPHNAATELAKIYRKVISE